MLIEHVVGLSSTFLNRAILVGLLHCWGCLGHGDEKCGKGKELESLGK